MELAAAAAAAAEAVAGGGNAGRRAAWSYLSSVEYAPVLLQVRHHHAQLPVRHASLLAV